METDYSANGHSSRDTINGLGQSLEKAIDQNRMLFSEMARFTNRESTHFVQQQVRRATHAVALFEQRRGLDGLIDAQQAWLNGMMRDFADQTVRYAEMFRTVTEHVHDQMKDTASEFGAGLEKATEKAQAAMREGARTAE